VYARAEQREDLKITRSRMEEHRVVKKPGISWIEVDGRLSYAGRLEILFDISWI
jgi:hypothetical protein